MELKKHTVKSIDINLMQTDIHVSKMIHLIEDLRTCCTIFTKASINATEVSDIDEIQVQDL